MKAIIVAAGPGTRLMPLTRDKPKCLLDVGGRTILDRIVEAMKQNGIDDIVMVTGHQSDVINHPGIRYYHNPDYKDNNILASLFYAEGEMDDAFVFSYSDILYRPSVLRKLLRSRGDIELVVDIDWLSRYKGRTLHPIDEAELVVVENGRVVKISKFMNPDVAHGEFIGLAKFSRRGAEILRRNYHRVRDNPWCGFRASHRFHDSVSLEKAYLTDMIQELIDRGYPVYSVDVKGGWFEIDTLQDLRSARRNLHLFE
ncbi:MAG: NTP transferase domain-containing protein [Candidatus Geothermarchaeales archaeon]